MIPVSIETIEKARAMLVKEAPARTGTGDSLDVQQYLAHYKVDVVKIKQNGTGTLYGLKQCIFDPSHSPNEAHIGQGVDGRLYYKCFHNSCQGRTWAEARERISGTDKLTPFLSSASGATTERQSANKPLEKFPEVEENTLNETPQKNRLVFPSIMAGAAGDFARLYSAYLEAPKHFFYCAFLACLGAFLSNKVTLKSEIRPQPRLYTVLLGESGEVRKSTAISKTVSFFQDRIIGFPVSWGVSSAEGLQARLKDEEQSSHDAVLLLVYDEFKTFVSKCKVEGSVLLPMCTTLFEANHYETRTKKLEIRLDRAYLSMLAASTVNTYEKIFDSSFGDIGMLNRIFVVPGDSQRKFSFPEPIPSNLKDALGEELNKVLGFVGQGRTLDLTQDAKQVYHEWYLSLEPSVHATRLDTYAMRFMPLLAINELKDEVDVEIVQKVLALMDWQLEARKAYDPVDADSEMGKMEEKIRRVLAAGPKTERKLKQFTHANRKGLWFFDTALKNLERAGEALFDKKARTWKGQNEKV